MKFSSNNINKWLKGPHMTISFTLSNKSHNPTFLKIFWHVKTFKILLLCHNHFSKSFIFQLSSLKMTQRECVNIYYHFHCYILSRTLSHQRHFIVRDKTIKPWRWCCKKVKWTRRKAFIYHRRWAQKKFFNSFII